MADPTEVRVTSSTGGQKGSKLCRMDLIPAEPLWMLGEIYGRGAEKYDERNWEKGYQWSLSLAALMRHLNRWQQGEIIDEDGFHHLTAVIFHAMALQYFEIHHPEFDDVHGVSVDPWEGEWVESDGEMMWRPAIQPQHAPTAP